MDGSVWYPTSLEATTVEKAIVYNFYRYAVPMEIYKNQSKNFEMGVILVILKNYLGYLTLKRHGQCSVILSLTKWLRGSTEPLSSMYRRSSMRITQTEASV